MSKINPKIAVWMLDLTTNTNIRLNNIVNQLKIYDIVITQWDPSCPHEYGLIFFNDKEKLSNIRDFMIMQMRHLGRRVILCYLSALEPLNNDEIFQCYEWGIDYFFDLNIIEKYPDTIPEVINRWYKIDSIRTSQKLCSRIIGKSVALKKLLRYCIEAILFSEAPILIIGERGTGKEMVAQLAHELDLKKDKCQLVLVDCTTVKPDLSGSELFGHEKGSYTGADHTREGAFALADNGTLFLDEIGELPIALQGELLRVIQEGIYKRLGSNIWRKTSFRLVSATNRDLGQRCEDGHFRKDLLDRLSVWKCYMPTLNERKEDIPLLVEYFLSKYMPDSKVEIDESVFGYLKERDYPGNIRELQHLVYRIATRHAGKYPITIGDIAPYDRTKVIHVDKWWYEKEEFTDALAAAVKAGYSMEQIEEVITEKVINIAFSLEGSNKNVAKKLNKSERWVQMNKTKSY